MPQIELLKRHTHAGIEQGAGSVIDVDDHTAQWLIEHGVGQSPVTVPAEPRRVRPDDAPPVYRPTANKE